MIREHRAPDRQDLALLGGRDVSAHDVVAGETGADQVFRAVLHPLHRLAGQQRADDRADVARVDRHLVAEAAADVGRDDPDLVLGQAGHDRIERAVGVWCLTRRPQGQPALDPVVVGNRTTRLHRRRVHTGVDDVLGDGHLGAGEHRVGRLRITGLPVEAVVVGLALEVGADHRGVGSQRLAHVDHRPQHFVVDVDEFESVSGGVPVLGHDERDLLTLKAHLVGRQHGLDVVGERRHPGQTLLCQHRSGHHQLDLRVGLGCGDVDVGDVRVRHR